MSFMKCVSSLRLLGKFLGFVAFLPYQTPDLLPDSVKESYVSMRDQVGGCLVYILEFFFALLEYNCNTIQNNYTSSQETRALWHFKKKKLETIKSV